MGLHSNTTILLTRAFVLELNNHRCELCWLYLFAEINGGKRINQLLKSPSSVGRYKIDENRRAKKMLNSSRDKN